MKIVKAEVVDPRRSTGEMVPPYLTVHLDEQPVPMGRNLVVSSSGSQLRFVQHGPFWHVEPTLDDTLLSEEELVGYANSASPTHLDKLVPVEVEWPEGARSMAMSVVRARTLLRKYKTGYEYTLSDIAARHGRIQWDLECKPLACMVWVGENVCGVIPVVDTVNVHGTQMPACSFHISAVRSMARDLRLQREGARK